MVVRKFMLMQSKPATVNGMGKSVATMVTYSSALVAGLIEPADANFDLGITRRLAELGFLPGERVTVLRRGPGGREPIAVQIGETVFALRNIEAACIGVNDQIALESA